MTRLELFCWCSLALGGGIALHSSWPSTDLIQWKGTGFVLGEIRTGEELPRRYALYVPRGYEHGARYPLIVFLHDIGAIGTDGRQQLKIGLAPYLCAHHRDGDGFPYFVLFPQARRPWCADTHDCQAVIDILDEMLRAYPISPDRVYLTAIGAGTDGLWSLGATHPDRWAALVPVSAMPMRAKVDLIASIPIRWYENCATGVEGARTAVTALRAAGASVDLIEFKDLGREAWTRAYADPGLYTWLDARVSSTRIATESRPTLSVVGRVGGRARM